MLTNLFSLVTCYILAYSFHTCRRAIAPPYAFHCPTTRGPLQQEHTSEQQPRNLEAAKSSPTTILSTHKRTNRQREKDVENLRPLVSCKDKKHRNLSLPTKIPRISPPRSVSQACDNRLSATTIPRPTVLRAQRPPTLHSSINDIKT